MTAMLSGMERGSRLTHEYDLFKSAVQAVCLALRQTTAHGLGKGYQYCLALAIQRPVRRSVMGPTFFNRPFCFQNDYIMEEAP